MFQMIDRRVFRVHIIFLFFFFLRTADVSLLRNDHEGNDEPNFTSIMYQLACIVNRSYSL